ncbi:MAG TPA: glycosyltransferase family 2 protein [Verrucomicrobiae bacterium]|nr:glycosyltransferase family 2 protein [Verrucomicrobiae bacterium]
MTSDPTNPPRLGVATPALERLPVSAFIICQDEEAYLANCIRSLYQCKEIVIVDSGSTDGTAALIKKFQDAGWPVRFIHQKWLGYAAQKQFALEQTTEPWALSIDSDERIDEDFRKLLPELIKASDDVSGWRIRRRAYLIGYGYTPKFVAERSNLRLIRKGRGAFDLTQKVHEGIHASTGIVKEAKRGSLLHYRPLPIDQQILKENKYSSLKADQRIAEGKGPRYVRLIFNPLFYFWRLYFKHKLVFCGFPGFIQAATGSVYSLLTEAKIFQRHAQKTHVLQDDMDGETLPPI